jgi:hypothetical protein
MESNYSLSDLLDLAAAHGWSAFGGVFHRERQSVYYAQDEDVPKVWAPGVRATRDWSEIEKMFSGFLPGGTFRNRRKKRDKSLARKRVTEVRAPFDNARPSGPDEPPWD